MKAKFNGEQAGGPVKIEATFHAEPLAMYLREAPGKGKLGPLEVEIGFGVGGEYLITFKDPTSTEGAWVVYRLDHEATIRALADDAEKRLADLKATRDTPKKRKGAK